MTGALIRQGHFLGTKLRTLRKRNGLTLDELSARCVQIDAEVAPSVSYLSMIENGRRMPSGELLAMLAGVFGKETRWFLDENTDVPPALPARRARGGLEAMPLEPAFLFSHDLLQIALPELLSQTATTGRQFAQLLIRVWQEVRHNDFPDIERAAEEVGHRRLPLSLEDVQQICRKLGLRMRWYAGKGDGPETMIRAHFEAPNTVWLNKRLRTQERRLKYDLAFFAGHRMLHSGDGLVSPHEATWAGEAAGQSPAAAMGQQDVLYAWRDFECSFFAGALLCPRAPFRRYLIRGGHGVLGGEQLGVTPAVIMRRMTAVSPYRHWHFFDAYAPGFLRAVYRGNGIPLPWGNMSLVPDPCPQWAVFRLLRQSADARSTANKPKSQISVMHDGRRARLYCCHSLQTRDAADVPHVLSVGVDLSPALDAQGYDSEAMVASVDHACHRSGGQAALSGEVTAALRAVAKVLSIRWIEDALDTPAAIICPRSSTCPRPPNSCR